MRHITMKKGLCTILVFVTLVLLSGMAVADVFPTVSLDSFDADTFEYVYEVYCPADMTYAFGQLWVKGELESAAPFEWTFGVASPFPVDTWDTELSNWAPGKTAAKWITTGDDVAPGSEWTGYFRITVPNSTPQMGEAITANGDLESWVEHPVDVMAPAVIPEPGSLLSLGLLAGGLIPFLRRRR